MIKFSNGHEFNYFVASGALGFDGLGYWWERPLVWLGLIKPELFAVAIKSLTRYSIRGNLRWSNPLTWLPFSPWSCVRLLSGELIVNKVGLTNPGVDYWCEKIGPKINFKKRKVIGSIFGIQEELVYMAKRLNFFDLVAIEVNDSCMNAGHRKRSAESIINSVKAVRGWSRHPIIVKVSADQDYLTIAKGLVGVAEAISLNSVPWKMVYGNLISPLEKIGKPGTGGGGISGERAKAYNWAVVRELFEQGSLPVIAPSIMKYEDLDCVRSLGAQAISFGAIHLRTPWKPTWIVRKELSKNG